MLKSTVVKRSVLIGSHRTSISLEDAFWNALNDIALGRNLKPRHLIEEVDKQREGNLSSALRLFVLEYYRSQAKQADDKR